MNCYSAHAPNLYTGAPNNAGAGGYADDKFSIRTVLSPLQIKFHHFAKKQNPWLVGNGHMGIWQTLSVLKKPLVLA